MSYGRSGHAPTSGAPPSGETSGGRGRKGGRKGGKGGRVCTSPGYVEEPRPSRSTTRMLAAEPVGEDNRSASRGRDRRVSASILEGDEEDEDVQFGSEEAETLRRADERYQLWRVRKSPTPHTTAQRAGQGAS